jgi:hypothetical protein
MTHAEVVEGDTKHPPVASDKFTRCPLFELHEAESGMRLMKLSGGHISQLNSREMATSIRERKLDGVPQEWQDRMQKFFHPGHPTRRDDVSMTGPVKRRIQWPPKEPHTMNAGVPLGFGDRDWRRILICNAGPATSENRRLGGGQRLFNG